MSVAVFLLVLFGGLYGKLAKVSRSGPEVVATSYALHGTALRLQPNSSSGSSVNLKAATLLSLTGMATDPEGRRWFAVRAAESDGFIAVTEIAPPKIRLPEVGSQMLRTWLLTFKDPELAPDAEAAVSYFCSQFPESSHCDELQWVAAERIRSLAQREGDTELLQRARRLYKSVSDKKGPMAPEAGKALRALEVGIAPLHPGGPSGTRRDGTRTTSATGASREYALVDRAEVQVKVPDLKSINVGSILKAPIAREIKVNGKVAIPSNATCILKVAERDSTEPFLMIQLTAIEFEGKHYDVTTEAQRISISGSVVVFTLESSLLVGH